MKALLALLVLMPLASVNASESCTYSLKDSEGNLLTEVTSHSYDACRDAQDSCLNAQETKANATECLELSPTLRYGRGPGHGPGIPAEPGYGRPDYGPGRNPGRPGAGGPSYPSYPSYPPNRPGYPPHMPPPPPRVYVCTTDLVSRYGSIVRSYTEYGNDRFSACNRSQSICQYELRRGNTTGSRCVVRY